MPFGIDDILVIAVTAWVGHRVGVAIGNADSKAHWNEVRKEAAKDGYRLPDNAEEEPYKPWL